jgi:hypothetical protein
MSKSIADGQQFHLYVKAGEKLKLGWLGGTYTATAIAGLAAGQQSLATNAAAHQTLGPWVRDIVARLAVSAPGRVEFATGATPEFGPPGKSYVRQSDGVTVVLTGIGPNAVFEAAGGGGGSAGAPFAVTGTFALGEVLTIVPATGWTVSAVQWKRQISGVATNISGATGLTYTLTSQDVADGVSILGTAGTLTYAAPAVGGIVTPPTPTLLTISGTPSTSATVGTPYSFTPTAAGGTAPRTFALIAGSLPAGLSFNTSTGAVTGTPTTASTAAGLTIRVTDSLGALADLAAFSLTVAAGAPVIIGGISTGTAGSGLYDGYVLSAGDEFDTLSIASASNPAGRYFATRGYSSNGGMRAPSSGALSNMHDVDPYYTGWNDSNRGNPIGSLSDSHQLVSGEGTSALRLRAKRQTSGEQTLLATGNASQIERAAMIDGAGWLTWDTPSIIEWRARLPVGPAGQHPTLWGLFADPPATSSNTGDEFGFEGHGSQTKPYLIAWTNHNQVLNAGALSSTGRDGNYHTFTVKQSETQFEYYIDGALVHTASVDPDGRGNKSERMLITNHVHAAWEGQTYSSSAWASAGANGVDVDIEWFRVWRRSTGKHLRPVVSLPDVMTTAGGALSVVLPAQSTLWGETGLTEYVTAINHELEQPGMTSNSVGFDRFPTGITYNEGTRTLSGTMPAQAGALYITVNAKGDGNTCEVARFRVCVAPVFKGAASYSGTVGDVVSLDAYAMWDHGRLMTPGTNPKGLTVSGLPAGLTLNATTGLITGTLTTVASPTITLGATNSAGQTTSVTRTYTVAAASVGVPVNSVAPVQSGTAQEGQTASLTTGTWTNSPSSYAYSWERVADGAAAGTGTVISGATASTYVYQAADIGSDVFGRVVATNGTGPSTAASSNRSDTVVAATIPGAPGVPAPTITGSPTLLYSFDPGKSDTVAINTGAVASLSGADGTTLTLSASGSARPTITTRGAIQVLDFTSANSQILTAAIGTPPTATNGFTLVLIEEPKAIGTSGDVLDLANGASASAINRLTIGRTLASSAYGYSTRKANATIFQDFRTAIAYPSGPNIAVAATGVGTADTALRWNGTATVATNPSGTNSANVSNPTNLDTLTLGGRTVSGAVANFANTYVYRVLVYSGTLSAAQCEEIAVWSATNYGTPNNA